jgi:hypothetical protein
LGRFGAAKIKPPNKRFAVDKPMLYDEHRVVLARQAKPLLDIIHFMRLNVAAITN